MDRFELSSFCKIKGIVAPSGLVYINNTLFLISDSSDFLYRFDIEKNYLMKLPLIENARENNEKKDKQDLESLTLYGKQLIMLGSGSRPNRENMFLLQLDNDTLERQDMGDLYKKLRELGDLKKDEFNIEGAIYAFQTMLLFQRGNAEDGKNGIFIIPNNPEKQMRFLPISLPFLDNVETSFTDALFFEDKIYFLAAAEKSDSTYNDGEILGTVLGIMDAPTFEIIEVHLLSYNQKFEGITFYKKTKKELHFLLCEDNDVLHDEATIHQLVLYI